MSQGILSRAALQLMTNSLNIKVPAILVRVLANVHPPRIFTHSFATHITSLRFGNLNAVPQYFHESGSTRVGSDLRRVGQRIPGLCFTHGLIDQQSMIWRAMKAPARD